MSKVYFDITDLINWPGNLTGIQRVSFNLAIRLKDEIPDAQFVKYNKYINKIVEANLNEIDYYNNYKNKDDKYKFNHHETFKYKIIQSGVYDLGKRYLPLYLKILIVKIYKIKSFYFKKIINSLKKQSAKNTKEIIFKKNDVYLLTAANDNWNLEGVVAILKEQKKINNIKIVHIIYDLIPIQFSQFFGSNGQFSKRYTNYLFEIIKLSDQLIAISKSVKLNLLDFIKSTKLPNKPINVIRLGDEINPNQNFKFEINDTDEPFILAVGTFEVRKNYLLLYMAYKLAEQEKIKLPKLIIVGKFGWLVENLNYLIKHDYLLEDKIIIKHNVSDEELSQLYKNCLFTVYPSIYEGWGLPIAESLAYGKMCLASSTSSMPEIAGQLIEYFNPYDAAYLLKLLEQYNDKDLLRKKELEIKNNYKITTWDKTAKQFYKFVVK